MESKKNKDKKERRRGFTLEFKAEAVRLLAERPAGVSVAQLARELDVRPEQLRAWARQRRDDASPSSVSPAGTRPGETRKPTTLQNAAGFLSEPPRSLPSASGNIPQASAAAAPPLLPPLLLVRS